MAEETNLDTEHLADESADDSKPKKSRKPRNSRPVGFQLETAAHDFYSSLALADRDRPVGTMCAIILKSVQPIAALLEVDRDLTADEILRRAGLDSKAADAVRKFTDAQAS